MGAEVEENNLGPVIGWEQLDSIRELLRPEVRSAERYLGWRAACLKRAQVYSRAFALDQAERILRELTTDR